MIDTNTLREFRPIIRYKDGQGITLQTVQEAIQTCADNLGIPVGFSEDQVKAGTFFNPTFEDCIVMYHPDHRDDYYNFCIRVTYQGTYAFVSVNDFGKSKQVSKADSAEFGKKDRKGKKLSYKIGSRIGQSIATIGMSKQALEEEQMYYQCILDIFDEILT